MSKLRGNTAREDGAEQRSKKSRAVTKLVRGGEGRG